MLSMKTETSFAYGARTRKVTRLSELTSGDMIGRFCWQFAGAATAPTTRNKMQHHFTATRLLMTRPKLIIFDCLLANAKYIPSGVSLRWNESPKEALGAPPVVSVTDLFPTTPRSHQRYVQAT